MRPSFGFYGNVQKHGASNILGAHVACVHAGEPPALPRTNLLAWH
jgi:hypothetical protein